ncbi:induced myeloid leukemia cell differentiation protein Mcl-1-like [Pholidichthys leucotaenia]
MEDSECGSLPCMPELQCDSEADVSGYSTAYKALENETKRLLSRFLLDFTGISKCQRNEEKAISTMKRVVNDVLQKHRYAYNGMINKLSLANRGDDMSFVSEVARSLFADQTTNWGRITSLVAFGAAVCQYLKEKGRENCVELVSQEISTYLLSEQRDWLLKNNSWDGFVEFFHVEDPESTVRRTLVAFAGLAGIGAALALNMR